MDDDARLQLECDHKWTGHKNYIPGEPDDYIEYCELCGMENPGSFVEPMDDDIYTPKERAIFRYYNGAQIVYGDPLHMDLRLREALGGNAKQVYEDYNDDEHPEVNIPATLKLIEATRAAFEMLPFDPLTGQGARDEHCLKALWDLWEWTEKNGSGAVSSPSGSRPSTSIPSSDPSPTSSTAG
jgi:hypothetical protein